MKTYFLVYFHSLALFELAPTWSNLILWILLQITGTYWGPDIPFLGIFVSKFRYYVFAVWEDAWDWTLDCWALAVGVLNHWLNAKSPKLHIIHTVGYISSTIPHYSKLHLIHDYSPSHQFYCTVHVKHYTFHPDAFAKNTL